MNVFDAIKIMHFQSNFYLTEFIMLMSFSNMEWLAEIFLGFKDSDAFVIFMYK